MAGYMDIIGKAGKSGGKKGRGNRPEHLEHGGRDTAQRADSMVDDEARAAMRDGPSKNTRNNGRDMRRVGRD